MHVDDVRCPAPARVSPPPSLLAPCHPSPISTVHVVYQWRAQLHLQYDKLRQLILTETSLGKRKVT